MLKIICHRYTWGAEYVNRLYAGVRRNTTVPFEFICFTDDPSGIDPAIAIRPLPVQLPPDWESREPYSANHWALGCLQRLPMFRRGMFPDGDQIAFLDLDTVFCGNLDGIFSYRGKFAILEDFYRGTGSLQFSFSTWEAGQEASAVYEAWKGAGEPYGVSDQTWIERAIPKPDILQSLFPGQFVSWKADNCRYGIPRQAKVIIFHGLPKPHEIKTGRLPALWREE